jgi:hypothetical protein
VLARESDAQLFADLIVIETLDGGDIRAAARHRISDTRTHRNAVEQNGTCATDTVLAAEMSSGERLGLADKIRKMGARLNLGGDRAAIDGK